MDLSLTEEQQMLADSVRDLFTAAPGDPTAGGQAPEDGLGFRRDLWLQAAETGLTGLPFDEKYGGSGAGIAEVWATTSTLGTLGAPDPLVDAAYLPGWIISDLGTEEQKHHWLSRISSGESVVTVAHAEPGVGWEGARSTSVSATGATLSGVKRAVTVPDAADTFLVTTGGADGPGVYLVRADAPGVTVTLHRNAEWLRTGTVTFDGAEAERLGDADSELVAAALRRATALGRIAQGGRAVGLMATAVSQTVDYLKVRRQFGVTLNRFQVLTHRAAQLYSDVELSRSMSLWAAAVAESLSGGAGSMSAADLDELTGSALDAYNFLLGRARTVAEEAVQLHGGIGVTYEAAVSHYAAALTGFRQLYGGELESLASGTSSPRLTVAPSALPGNAIATGAAGAPRS